MSTLENGFIAGEPPDGGASTSLASDIPFDRRENGYVSVKNSKLQITT
jgi:hypothetical protein